MVNEFKQKIESSNLLHKDLSLQPEGKFVLLFQTANSAGALSVDAHEVHPSGRIISFFRVTEHEDSIPVPGSILRTRDLVAVLTNDMPWILVAKDRIVNLTTKQLWEKQLADSKGMKAAAEELKIPVVTAEDLMKMSEDEKPSVGHYL